MWIEIYIYQQIVAIDIRRTTMTLEELRSEANKLGYSLCRQIAYEKVSTCKCGSKRIASELWLHHTKYYRCTNCGLKSQPAKTKYQAIINWNKAVKEKQNEQTN